MTENEKPLFEGYTTRGGESVTKPSYKPSDLVIKAFEEGIKVKNFFKDRQKPLEPKKVETPPPEKL